jgi:hypothetical protein
LNQDAGRRIGRELGVMIPHNEENEVKGRKVNAKP